MQIYVRKWGKSLAVRLPSAIVDALDLKEGDRVEIRVAGARQALDPRIEKALARIRRLRRPLSPGFRFDRMEAHER